MNYTAETEGESWEEEKDSVKHTEMKNGGEETIGTTTEEIDIVIPTQEKTERFVLILARYSTSVEDFRY